MQKVSLADRIFRDQQGQAVIFQWPNLLIWLALMAWLTQQLVTFEPTHTIAQGFFDGVLLVWAIQELATGVNLFRRGLGLVVSAWLIYAVLQSGAWLR